MITPRKRHSSRRHHKGPKHQTQTPRIQRDNGRYLPKRGIRLSQRRQNRPRRRSQITHIPARRITIHPTTNTSHGNIPARTHELALRWRWKSHESRQTKSQGLQGRRKNKSNTQGSRRTKRGERGPIRSRRPSKELQKTHRIRSQNIKGHIHGRVLRHRQNPSTKSRSRRSRSITP